jgi:hypothetical protein
MPREIMSWVGMHIYSEVTIVDFSVNGGRLVEVPASTYPVTVRVCRPLTRHDDPAMLLGI